MLQHACLNIDYGLSNFKKHKVYNLNPAVKAKQQIKETKHSQPNLFESNIGISIPHLRSNENLFL